MLDRIVQLRAELAEANVERRNRLAQLTAKAGVAPGTYKLAVGKNATTSTVVYDESQEFALDGTPVFVVLSYDFMTSNTTDAVAKLWINPDPSTFGAAAEPGTPSAISAPAAITDITTLASFVAYQYGAAGTSSGISRIDEVRVGTTWADVTVPEPASLSLLALGATALIRRRRQA